MEEKEAYISLVVKCVSQVEVDAIYIFLVLKCVIRVDGEVIFFSLVLKCVTRRERKEFILRCSKVCYRSKRERNLYTIYTSLVLCFVSVMLVIAYCFVQEMFNYLRIGHDKQAKSSN